MIESATQEDIDAICDATNQDAVKNIIAVIVSRMPEPRAYICEPEAPADPQRLLWEEGLAILTQDLSARKISVVDPESIRELAAFYEDTYRAISEATAIDPMFFYLVSRRMIQEIYIPEGTDKLHTRLVNEQRFAKGKKVKIHLWRPVVYR